MAFLGKSPPVGSGKEPSIWTTVIQKWVKKKDKNHLLKWVQGFKSGSFEKKPCVTSNESTTPQFLQWFLETFHLNFSLGLLVFKVCGFVDIYKYFVYFFRDYTLNHTWLNLFFMFNRFFSTWKAHWVWPVKARKLSRDVTVNTASSRPSFWKSPQSSAIVITKGFFFR